MSIKIYTGFKYKTQSPQEPIKIAFKIRGLLMLKFSHPNVDEIIQLGVLSLEEDSYGVILGNYAITDPLWRMLVSDRLIIPYEYFDNTDPPPYMLDDEWERRRASWSIIFGNDPMKERMFFIDIPFRRLTIPA